MQMTESRPKRKRQGNKEKRNDRQRSKQAGANTLACLHADWRKIATHATARHKTTQYDIRQQHHETHGTGRTRQDKTRQRVRADKKAAK